MDISAEMVDDERVEYILSFFDTTPEKFAFRSPIPREILTRRAQMSDVLIFDILLTSGNIRHPHALYPPPDVPALRNLLVSIENSTYDTLKKDCLVYFLLKWHPDERAASFQEARCIPPQFIALADAYWCLDCGTDIPRAVSLLSDARLNRDYTSKVLQAILLSKNPNPFIRKYIRTAKPLLTEPDDIDTYVIALADSSLLEAWQYQQAFPEGETRSRMINRILRWCLEPKPRPVPLKQLLGYTFSVYEQGLVHGFAIRPPPSLSSTSITAIQDLVCLRLILGGQVAAAVKLNRQFPVVSTSEGRRAAQERKQNMLDEAVALLPAAERQLLELELERSSQNGDIVASGSGDSWANAVDLNMSWEHIESPSGSANGSAAKPAPRSSDVFTQNPRTPIPKKSGAPRFSGPLSALGYTPNHESPSFVLGRNPVSPQSPKSPPLASSSRVRSLVAKFQPTPPSKPAGSLYDTLGSANMKRNAFYEPPVSAGTKRPLEQVSPHGLASSTMSSGRLAADTSSASASAVIHELMREEGGDVDMDVSYEHDAEEVEPEPEPEQAASEAGAGESHIPETQEKPHADALLAEVDEGEDPKELSFSLFSTGAPLPPPISKTESGPKLPPGAFYLDSDGESEVAPPPPPPVTTRPRKSEPVPPAESVSGLSERRRRSQPPPKPTPSAMHTVRPRTSAKLRSSLPGTLINDELGEEEEQQEEEDVVPPLQPISTGSTGTRRQGARKSSRASRGGDTEKEKKEPTRPTRRSSRLSVVSASSRGSSSPEPPSPVKPKRTSRTSVPAVTPKKKATKQR